MKSLRGRLDLLVLFILFCTQTAEQNHLSLSLSLHVLGVPNLFFRKSIVVLFVFVLNVQKPFTFYRFSFPPEVPP